MKLVPSKPSTEKIRFTQLTIPLAGRAPRMHVKPLPKQKKRDKSEVCAPPTNPTAVPWAPWVNEVDAMPEWKLSGKKAWPSEWATALEEEGLVDFMLDHPNNPCTSRYYERSSGDGGSVISAVYFDRRAEGASGYVHEGAIAAVADSLAVFHNMVSGDEGVTKTLDVSFCKPIPLDTCMRADCHETNRKGEEVQRKGSIVDGIDQSIVYAEFDAVFVVLSKELLKYFAQLTPENTMSRGLARRFPLLSMEPEACLMDTKVVQELVGKTDSDCTQVFKENRQSRYPLGHSSGYVSASGRMQAAYFIGPDRFVSVFSATVECMGPLECVHGGCIFTWFAESVIACMRLRAPFLGVMASRGALKKMSVKYLQRAPLSDIYGIHVTILKEERDSTTDCWNFDLKAEMKSPATGVVLNEASAEFECGHNQSWELFDHEFIKPRWWAAHDFQNVASSPTLLGRGRVKGDQKICQGDLQTKQDMNLSACQPVSPSA